MLRFELKDCVSGKEAVPKTYVEATSDAENLYFRIVADSPDPRPKYSEFNSPLYEGDVVEIFLTLGNRTRYLELEFNENGAIFAAVIDNPHCDRSFSSVALPSFGGMAEGRRVGQLFVTDVTLPIAWLGDLGYKRDIAYINFCREDFDSDGKMAISASSPTYCENFHQPMAFEKIEL